MVFIYCKNRTETLSRGLFVKEFEFRGFWKITRSGSGTFLTGVFPTHQYDRWDPRTHLSMTAQEGKKGVFIRSGLGLEPETDLAMQGTTTNWVGQRILARGGTEVL